MLDHHWKRDASKPVEAQEFLWGIWRRFKVLPPLFPFFVVEVALRTFHSMSAGQTAPSHSFSS